MGVSQLAECLSIHQTTCSQLVEKLVARKYLVKLRSTEDQRRVGLTLTAAASKLIDKAPGPAEGVLPEALLRLPPAALAALTRELEKVSAQLAHADHKAAGKPLADL
jgi:DNA-binding MarR family transcriptional regulator